MEIFDKLLKFGFDYHRINENKENLIHVAVKVDNVDMVHKLITLGNDPTMQNENNARPIHFVKSVQMF